MCEIQNEAPQMPFDFAGDLTAITVKRTKKDMTDWQIIKEINQIIKSAGQKVNGSGGNTCQLTTQVILCHNLPMPTHVSVRVANCRGK